jgi:Glyoxalase-like domain
MIVQGIDHLIVMVQELDRSAAAWQALGFAITPRGFHQTGGTANHLIMLEGTYIELLGMADSRTTSPYRAMMDSPGLWGIALRGSAERTYALWRERDLEVSDPTQLARGVEIDGKNELARFHLTMLERSASLPFLIFCCEQLTPQFVWRKDRPPHANGAVRLKELVVVADDARVSHEFERVTGGDLASSAHGTSRIALGDSSLTFHSPATYRDRYGDAGNLSRGELPQLAAMVLTSRDLPRARELARRAGARTQETANGFTAALTREGVLIEWLPEL